MALRSRRVPAQGQRPMSRRGWMEDESRGCSNPVHLPTVWRDRKVDARPIDDPKRAWVHCGKCRNCLRDRAKDWVGRSIAEAYGADRAYFVTLTVGGSPYYRQRGEDNMRAILFHKADVQSFIDRLRTYTRRDWVKRLKEGGIDHREMVPPKLRMFYVGEHGDELGRVHYHLLLYMYGCEAPDDVLPWLDKCVNHGAMDASVDLRHFPAAGSGDRTYWPWGYCRWQEAHPRHSHYLAWYVNKGWDGGAGDVMRPGISTRPLLGAGYFDALASDYVAAGLSPQARTYRTPYDNPNYEGKPLEFWLSDAGARYLVRSFKSQWAAAFAADPRNFPREWPRSDFVDVIDDGTARLELGRVRDDVIDVLVPSIMAESTRLPGRYVRKDFRGFVAAQWGIPLRSWEWLVYERSRARDRFGHV